MRQRIANPRASFSAAFATPEWLNNRKAFLAGRHSGQTLSPANGIRKIRSVESVELVLVIEQIDMAGTTRLKQIDHTFGLRGKVAANQQRRRLALARQLSYWRRLPAGC